MVCLQYNAEKLLEEILARVEDGELPDAAEKEAQWSSFITTSIQSTKLQTKGISESAVSPGKTLKGSKISRTHSKQATEGHCVTGKEMCPTHHKRKLAPVDEGMILIALHLQVTREREG